MNRNWDCRSWTWIGRAALVWLLLGSSTAAASTGLLWEPCSLGGTDEGLTRYAECASFERPLDPAGKVPGMLRLAVSRLRSSSPQPADNAVIAINGGPGGSSRAMLVDLWAAFRTLAADRDVIVLDQRGTGDSAALRCAAPDDPTADPGRDAIITAARACLAQLPHDPRFFTTSVAVTDIEALRVQLGYRQWNLYGVSYGTRVAAHYARQYPQATRALILDSIVPPPTILGANVITNSQAALDSLDRRCLAEAGCAQAFGSIAATLRRLQQTWQTPVQVELADPVHGAPERIALTYAHLAAVVRLLLYAPETAAILPLVIHEAANGNPVPAAAQVKLMLEKVSGSLADAMHNSVVCTEDVPFFGAAERDATTLQATYLGNALVETLTAVCSVWPRGPMDANLHEPLRSDLPALLIAGGLDPITPPAQALQMHADLPNSRVLVAANQGHSVLGRGCAARLAARFLDTLDPESLSATCLDNNSTLPVFIDLAGPAP